VIGALVRSERLSWGVAGSQVVRRALDQHGYVDARSYLKTPRIFGFHGVYKRLAIHLGLVDIHLGPGPNAGALVDAWARGLGGSLSTARPRLSRWSAAVRRSLGEKPPRTKTGWSNAEWEELAASFDPTAAKVREKRFLRDLLHAKDDRSLGAFAKIWELQADFDDDDFEEEVLHTKLEKCAPAFGPLVRAIRAYEAFARSLQDAFDVLKAEAASRDAQGFAIPDIAAAKDFSRSVEGLDEKFEVARRALGEVNLTNLSLPNLFEDRFKAFEAPMDARACALALCDHHEAVQKAKSADGKRPWFDRIGADRIYIRHAYREPRRDITPSRHVHDYRGWPIRRFCGDLRE